MKIKKLFIFFPLFNRGGLEDVAINILNSYKKYNLKVYFFTFEKKKIHSLKNKKLKIISPKIKSSKKISNIQKLYFCSKLFLRILKKNNPNECAILSLQNSVIPIILSKIYNYRVVIKNATPINAFIYGNYFKNLLVFILKIFFYNFADKIIVNSDHNKKTLGKFIFNKKKIIKIYNPVNLKSYKKNFSRKNYILYVGRIVKEKGMDLLLNTFQLLKDKDYKLILVGDGDYLKDFKIKVKNYNLGHKVKFIGWTKKVNKYYLNSKVLILPSFFEGFGNVLIEGMHHKIPCVAAKNSGGPDEILANGKFGFMFDSKNKHDLKNKILLSLSYNSLVKKKIYLAKKSLKRFSLKKCITNYHDVISSLHN